jgi:hypothetical protein
MIRHKWVCEVTNNVKGGTARLRQNLPPATGLLPNANYGIARPAVITE